MAKRILSILLAGVLALTALEGFARLYFNKPVRHECIDGATDYVWDSSTFYSQWTEGYGWGHTNNEGYYDLKDYEPGMNIDVLMMGASFIQGGEVEQHKTCSSLLEEMMPGSTVYNIGVSGHYFLNCVGNLDAALAKYRPKFVVIETNVVDFEPEAVRSVLDGSIESLYSNPGRLVELVQKSCFLRLLYYQLSYYREAHGGIFSPPELKPLFGSVNSESEISALPAEVPAEPEVKEQMLNVLCAYIAETADKYGTQVIVFFHPKTYLSGHGDIWTYDTTVNGFAEACENNGILLSNFTDRTRTEYYENHILPYGFPNSQVGEGHFNADGHRLAAEELYKAINGGN